MKKIKHKYVSKPKTEFREGTVSFLIDTDKGQCGVYEILSNFDNKFQALRYLVYRKHQIQNKEFRVKLK